VANRHRYIHLQEEYIKDEQRSLKRELVRAQEEIKRIQTLYEMLFGILGEPYAHIQ
jgi:hypothetical protein